MEAHHHLGLDLEEGQVALEVSEALGQGEMGEVLQPPQLLQAIPIATLAAEEMQEDLVASAALEALDQVEAQEEIQDHLPAPRLPQLLQLQVHPPPVLVLRDQDQDLEALEALGQGEVQVLVEEIRGQLRPRELLLPEALLGQVEPTVEDSGASEEEALLGLLLELLPELQLLELQLLEQLQPEQLQPELQQPELLQLELPPQLDLHLQDQTPEDQPGPILEVLAAQLGEDSEVSEGSEAVRLELSEEAQAQETQAQAAHQPQLQPQ